MAAAACLLAAAIALSGCSPVLKPIEGLMRPPYQTDDIELQKALSALLGPGVTFTAPEAGDYHSAVVLHDMDSDGEDEAVVFYTDDSTSSLVHLALFSKDPETGWQSIYDRAGNGSGVYSLEFRDLNSDGFEDILASWYMLEFMSSKILSVYFCSSFDGRLTLSSAASEAYSQMTCISEAGASSSMLVLVHTDTAEIPTRTSAKLFKATDDFKVTLTGETALDSRILSVLSLKTDSPAGSAMPRIFVDAAIGDKRIVTEVLKWNAGNGSYYSVFTDKSTEHNTATQRSDNLPNDDIDGDSLIEIPLRAYLPLLSGDEDDYTGYAVEWFGVKGTELKFKERYLVNVEQNYRLHMPAGWQNKVFLMIDEDSGDWSFTNAEGNFLFDIKRFPKAGFDEKTADISEILSVAGDYVFATEISEEGKAFVSDGSELIGNFELL